MGEIAAMMLDGSCCEACGAYIGEAVGFPRYCSTECLSDGPALQYKYTSHFGSVPNPLKMSCPKCGRRIKKAGLRDHMRDAHGKKP